ncbi:MAG: hypothetical protein ACLT2Z_00275 [Eubacterium sp.]
MERGVINLELALITKKKLLKRLQCVDGKGTSDSRLDNIART